jgi:hypothetical protein
MNQAPSPTRSRSRIVSGAGAVALIALATLALVAGPSWSSLASTGVVVARSSVVGATTALVAGPGTAAETTRPSRAAEQPRNGFPPPGEESRRAPAPSPALGLARSTPVRLRIDAIGVDTDLVGLGLETDGTMEVPDGAFPAGWYRGAPSPGELGPAVIVGHVDWAGEPGVFADLGGLAAGDEVTVAREDGTTAVFVITAIQRVSKRDFPTAAVYGDLDHPGLRLITCGGVFDRDAASYEDNVIAFAELDRVIDGARSGSSVTTPTS